MEDVILSRKILKDILIRYYNGIDIIPASSGVERITDLEPDQIKRLIREFSELSGYDYFFIDTSAGISRNVVSFCMASSEVIMVITSESTSLTDAYALLTVLSMNGYKNSVKVVVNQAKSLRIAKIAYSKLRETVEKFLPIGVLPLGVVIHDSHVLEAVKAQTPNL